MINLQRLFLIGVLLMPLKGITNPAEEGRALGESLHQQGYSDASPSLGEIENALIQNPEQAAFRAQNSHLSTSFEQQAEAGKKDEDPLKSTLAHQTGQRSTQTISTQPSLKETEDLLKQKHRFSIHASDSVLHPDLTQVNLSEEDVKSCNAAIATEKSQKASPQIVKCRQSPPLSEVNCTKNLKIGWVYGPALEKKTEFAIQVTPYRGHHWGGWFRFNLDLVHGTQNVYEHRWRHRYWEEFYHRHWAHSLSIQSSQVLSIDPTQDRGQSACSIVSDNPVMSCQFLEEPSASNAYVAKIHCNVNSQNGPANALLHFKGTFFEANKQLVERWEGCEVLEAQERAGFCHLASNEHQDLEQSKTIEGYPGHIHRDHWMELRSYVCGEGRNINECQAFIDQGCEQIDSHCAVLKDGVCLEYENTFRCGVPNYAKGTGLALDQSKLGFLKGEEEASIGYEAGDFGQGISHFHAMTEMAKPMEEGLEGIGQDENNPTVFRGNSKQCRVSCAPGLFRDCCKLKGLLQDFLGGCNDDERQLAIAAARQSRCVRVGGRYCSKRIKLGFIKICVEKRDSYCCYGSKLARIIQEIAHQQLGLSFGTEQSPNCGSLTAEQLSRINFDTPYARSKLSEILGEVQASAEQKFQAVQEAVSKLGPVPDKIKDLEEALEKKSKDLKRQHQIQNPSPILEAQP
ncbi:MAG: conjugal transfer protein TraN [Gammaproteobacteria bacterium]|nr:conjugal transfer protein TraN [Gammaproteobacteria bacterium]